MVSCLECKTRSSNSNLHKGLVFASSYVVGFLIFGLFNSLGVTFVDIMSTFNATRTQTAVIFSTMAASAFGTGFINGMIIQRFGMVKCGIMSSAVASLALVACFFASSILMMIFFIGILYGIGSSCANISATSAIGHYFSGKGRLLMLSLQTTSGAIGGVLYPYYIRLLIDAYGLRGALLIVGGVLMNCVPVCLLWKMPHETSAEDRHDTSVINSEHIQKYQANLDLYVTFTDDTISIKRNTCQSLSRDNVIHFINKFPVLHDDSKTRRVFIHSCDFKDAEIDKKGTIIQNLKSLANNTSFVMFLFGCSLSLSAVSVTFFIFITDLFRDKGLEIGDAAFGLLLINIVSIIGRLLPGLLQQVKNIPAMLAPIIASLLATLCLLIFALTKARVILLIVCVVVGISFGMSIAIIYVVTTKLVGTKTLPFAVGIIFTARGIGYAIAGPVNGLIRDRYGSYTISLYVAAGATLLSVLLFFTAWMSEKRHKRITTRETSEFYITSF